MLYVLWMLASLVAYVGGLVILLKVTPMLLSRAYDDGLFMAIAAGDILGGIFTFGAIAITFGLFSGSLGIRALDFFLLLGIFAVCAHLSYRIFKRYSAKINRISRIIAGVYCLLLALAALYYIVLLFT